jgi:hypothetical protein
MEQTAGAPSSKGQRRQINWNQNGSMADFSMPSSLIFVQFFLLVVS